MLDGLFPDDIMLEWADPSDASKPLFPEEEALVAGAIPKRRNEFAKGRECARAALERLGLTGVVLLRGASREPLWPAGVVGSITHTAGLCAAVVARAERYAGIGIDVEPAESLRPEVAERVCRNVKAELVSVPALESAVVPRLVFCVKEAAYKCQFPLTRASVGLDDIEVELGDGIATARLVVDASPLRAGTSFTGRWRRVGGFFWTGAWLPR